MSSKGPGAGLPFFPRRFMMSMIAVIFFLIAMAAAIYWLTSGDPEKRLGRARMIEELKKEQREKSPEAPVGYDVTPLVDGEYFHRLTKDLKRAGQSIEVLMFEIKLGKSPDNPANQLVSDLISAKDRGVSVRVRLEQSELDKSLTRINRRTADFLKAHGIFADFDLPKVETHAKVVLIDGRILYIGNHNWSESALMENREVSIRVESPKAITAMRRYFERFDRSLEKARKGEAG